MLDAKKLLRRGGGGNAASFEEQNAGGEEHRFAKIVGDEDDGLAEAAREGAELALKLGARNGIEGAEGLVHQENGRVGGEGAGHAHALALAAGKLVRVAVGVFTRVESNQGHELADANGSAAAVPFFERRNQGDVLGNGEMGEKASGLNDIAHTAAEADRIPVRSGAGVDNHRA